MLPVHSDEALPCASQASAAERRELSSWLLAGMAWGWQGGGGCDDDVCLGKPTMVQWCAQLVSLILSQQVQRAVVRAARPGLWGLMGAAAHVHSGAGRITFAREPCAQQGHALLLSWQLLHSTTAGRKGCSIAGPGCTAAGRHSHSDHAKHSTGSLIPEVYFRGQYSCCMWWQRSMLLLHGAGDSVACPRGARQAACHVQAMRHLCACWD